MNAGCWHEDFEGVKYARLAVSDSASGVASEKWEPAMLNTSLLSIAHVM
jgi:hypothetical protein